MGTIGRLVAVPGLLRWRALVLRSRVRARLGGHSLRVRSGPGVRCGRRVRIEVRGPGCVVEVGRGCRLHDDVLIDMAGGAARLGPDVELRPRVVLRVARGAELRLDGHNMLSYGTVIHASEAVRLQDRASVAEYVTIIDSNHVPGLADQNFRDSLSTAPVDVGENVWIGAKATIMPGTRIGRGAVVAGTAVVVDDVPAGTTVGGVPARVLKDGSASAHP